MREEAGLNASQWDQIGTIVTIPSFCDEKIAIWLARGLTPAERNLDHDEVINVDRVNLDEAVRMVQRGEIVDAKTIAALYQVRDFLLV